MLHYSRLFRLVLGRPRFTFGASQSRELERHCLRSVAQGGDPWTMDVECTLAMGPAMEGDGADEYIFIHRVLETTQACPCSTSRYRTARICCPADRPW